VLQSLSDRQVPASNTSLVVLHPSVPSESSSAVVPPASLPPYPSTTTTFPGPLSVSTSVPVSIPRANLNSDGSFPIPAPRRTSRKTAGQHSNPFHLPRQTGTSVNLAGGVCSGRDAQDVQIAAFEVSDVGNTS
jgi:hypothetical protein